LIIKSVAESNVHTSAFFLIIVAREPDSAFGRAITCFEGDHVMKTYDLVIIGSGTGAQAASSRMRAAGWSVALIDHRPFGGTCALRGCDPKRVLMSGGEAIDA